MKTFIASLCVFSSLLLLIAWNVRFVNRATEELETQIQTLDFRESASEKVEQLDAKWQKYRKVLSFSVSYNEIREMDVCIAQMRAAAKEQDAVQFESARLMALDSIKDLRRLERVTLTSIL